MTNEPEPKATNLMTFVDEWSRCISTVNQLGVYYRQGKFDDCSMEWDDINMALSAKFARNPDEARKILAETSLAKRTIESPTVGVIWKLKDKPGWGIH